jgi:hypothetical protein
VANYCNHVCRESFYRKIYEEREARESKIKIIRLPGGLEIRNDIIGKYIADGSGLYKVNKKKGWGGGH